MKKLFFLLCFLPAFSICIFAQSETTPKKKNKEHVEIERSVDEAMREVREALRDIDIPDIDFKEIMREVEDAMPTKEEMDEIKDVVVESIKIVEDLDLSFIEDLVRDIEEIVEDIEIDVRKDKSKDKSKEKSKEKNKRPKKDY